MRPMKKKCIEGVGLSKFKLPVFSPDLRKCIREDAFYTSTQRNRLIKESCVALRGYLWEREATVSNADKRALAKALYMLAPRSLGDTNGDDSRPEVGIGVCMLV